MGQLTSSLRRSGVCLRFRQPTVQLRSELAILRQPFREDGPQPTGAVAKRMASAVAPYAPQTFITPMAAVAGAVAEEILEVMTSADLDRAYVYDGGDIAIHL